MPRADVIYACDPHFFDAKRPDGTPYLDEMRAHGAELWTQDAGAAQRHALNWIRGVGEAGLRRKDGINYGGNSGYQAINLAYLWGARRIVLLGFDMQVGPRNESHWFGDHPKRQGFANPTVFEEWLRNFKLLARDLADAGVDVFNATRQTALTCFERTTLDVLPP